MLRLLGEGLTNSEIAERLFISPKTAEHHVSRIYAKLGVSTRAEAAAYAARNLGGPNRGRCPYRGARPDAMLAGKRRREDMMSEQNKEVVREYYAAGHQRPRSRRGRRVLRRRAAWSRACKGGCFRYFEAFPDLHVALDELIAEGDRVFLRSTMTGTHDGEYKGIPATGRHVAAECGRGLPHRRREVRRLLVPDERRRADAPAHRGSRGRHRLVDAGKEKIRCRRHRRRLRPRRSSSRGTRGTSRTSARTRSGSRRTRRTPISRRSSSGLPDDRCQCPHMGYVVKGKVKFTFTDGHEEVYEAGDAYYAPPGHLPTSTPAREVVEFSPTAELQQTMEVVEQNMAAANA